ncbi:DUF1559 domain-containing protein [bacterium]|nr:DUF1559 domain-containing protein [bacterium]
MARAGRGFTYLEILIALAVVVVVIGLLVPAVMKLRAAAERARCANHLKQLGAAALAYHDVRGHFPAGGSPTPDLSAVTPDCRAAAGWSWAYLLLPHLGLEQVYRDPDPRGVRHTPVPVFLCAARRTADPGGLAKIDYAANGSSDPFGPTGAFAQTGTPELRLGDVRGGTAGLVLFAGKRLNRAALGASLDDDDAYATVGWGPDFEVHRTAAEPPAPDVNEPGVLAPRSGFGSAHVGVFCAGFADGSVRPLRYTIDPALWQRACHRSGAPEPPSPNS